MQSVTLVGVFLIILGMFIFADQDTLQSIHQYVLTSELPSKVEPDQIITSPIFLGVMAFMGGIVLIWEVLRKVSHQCDKFEERKYGHIRHA